MRPLRFALTASALAVAVGLGLLVPVSGTLAAPSGAPRATPPPSGAPPLSARLGPEN